MKSRLPLVVGVTGHSDLRANDQQRLRIEVRRFFIDLRNKCPDTPILLLSRLARGAEQLVAEVALEMKDWQELDVSLVVLMPMPEQLYLSDIASDGNVEAMEKFRRLRARAVRCIELPMAPPESQATGVTADDHENRRRQYLLSGLFVARHCHIVLALLDRLPEHDGPTPQDDLFGAATIVRFKRAGRLMPRNEGQEWLNQVPDPYGYHEDSLEAPETGPVYHIAPCRVALVDGVEPLTNAHWAAPEAYDSATDKQRNDYFGRLETIHYGHLAKFNSCAKHLDGLDFPPRRWRSAREDWQSVRKRFLPDGSTVDAPKSLIALRDACAAVDVVAVQFQTWLDRGVGWLLALIVVAVAAFGIYAHLMQHEMSYWVLAAYLLLLAVADFVHLNWLKRRDYQNEHQDCRTIAEGLRVQLYWRLAGLEELASDYYLRKQMNELEWIRNAVRAWGLRPPLWCRVV